MPGFTLVEYIPAAPREAFYFLVSVENAPKLSATIKETRKLSAGPLGVGARYQQTRQAKGKEIQNHYEVLEFDAPRTYAVSGQREGVQVIYRYTLEEEDNRTRIQLDCTVEAGGLRRPLAWLVAEAMKRRDAELLRKLKLAIQSEKERSTPKDP